MLYLFVKITITGSRTITKAPERQGWRRGGRWLPVTELRPDYAKHGKAAPHVRNAELVRRADMVLACWDGQSKGTASTLRKARAMKKPTRIVLAEKPKPPEPPKQTAMW